jgi:hypothetical protein
MHHRGLHTGSDVAGHLNRMVLMHTSGGLQRKFMANPYDIGRDGVI